MQRLLIVARRYEPELRSATSAATRAFPDGFLGAARDEVYEYIKRYLRQQCVPWHDCLLDPACVPESQVYFTCG